MLKHQACILIVTVIVDLANQTVNVCVHANVVLMVHIRFSVHKTMIIITPGDLRHAKQPSRLKTRLFFSSTAILPH